MKLNVEIDLDSQFLEDGTTYLDSILDHAARQLLTKLTAGGNDDYPWMDAFQRRVDGITDGMVRAEVAPVIQAEMENVSFRPRNTYGDPVGPESGIKGFIAEVIKRELEVKTGRTYNSSDSTLEKFIKDEIKGALTKDLREAVADARKQVTQALRDQAASVIEETITKLAKV